MRDQLNKGKRLETPLKQKNKTFFQGGETINMKQRKIIASFLAIAMLLSLVVVPVGTVDAASNNSVDRVLQVSTTATIAVGDAPRLRIEEKNTNEYTNNQTYNFRLELTNAEFDNVAGIDAAAKAAAFGSHASTPSAITVSALSKTMVNVEVFTGFPAASAKRGFVIPLASKIKGSGEVTVTINPIDAPISPSTETFAIAASGGSNAQISGTKNFSNTVTLNDIIIDENRISSLNGNNGVLRLRLNNGFEWNATPTMTFSGGITNASTGAFAVPVFAAPDGRDVSSNGNLQIVSAGTRGTIVLKNLQVKSTSNASFGDVTVTISGDKFTTQTLTVAKFQDYGVTAVADGSPKELYSGDWSGNAWVNTADNTLKDTTATEHLLQKLHLKESTLNAWLLDRRTRIEFPSNVKIIGVVATGSKGLTGGSFSVAGANLSDTNYGRSFVEFNGEERDGSTDAAEVKLEFLVSVEAGYEGDIVAKVSGNAVGSVTEVVLGTVKPRATVEVEASQVRLGLLNQSLADVTVTETDAESIRDGNLTISLGRSNDGFKWSKVPTITVVEGDIDLDISAATVNVDQGRTLTIPVKATSSTPSKIVITNGQIDIDRTVPEGKFSVSVGGDAVVTNSAAANAVEISRGSFTKSSVSSSATIEVVTPAPDYLVPGDVAPATIVFSVDSNTYTVDGVEKVMEFAPFIQDGRTMLPVRLVAELVGVSDDNIIWNGVTKQVTLMKGDRISQMQIGSSDMIVNGVTVGMDTTAAIKDGRTVLPIRFVAQALGINIDWDPATRTVTIN